MMGMSALQFQAWVYETAATAEKAAATAMGAVDAYSTAYAATIPPEEVVRNQTTTATLIATNFMGVNSAAIAASEAQYQEYWAQDASAMLTYAATNTTLAAALNAPPFMPAIPNTDPAGLAGQVASVGEATGQSAGQASSTVGQTMGQMSSMGSSLGGLGQVAQAPAHAMSAIPQLLQQLSQPLSQLSQMGSMMGGGGQFGSFLQPLMGMFPGIMSSTGGLGSLGSLGNLGSAGYSPGLGATPITATMGRAVPMGGLSAPESFNQIRVTGATTTSPMKSFTPEGFVAQEDAGQAGAPMRGGMPMMGGAMMPGQGGGLVASSNRRILREAEIYGRQVF